MILLSDSIFHCLHQVQQLLKMNKGFGVSLKRLFKSTCYLPTVYLFLFPELRTFQVLVEAAQHMIGCCSHIWVVAAQSHHCHSHGMAGYELQAVNHTLLHRKRKKNKHKNDQRT